MGHDKSTAEIDPGDGAIIPCISYQVKEVEQFIIGQVNLALGARSAVNSRHMFFSKHSSGKFEPLSFSKFQVAKLDFIV